MNVNVTTSEEGESFYSSTPYDYLSSILYSSSPLGTPTEAQTSSADYDTVTQTQGDAALNQSTTDLPPWIFSTVLDNETTEATPTTLPPPLDCSSLDYNYDPVTSVLCLGLFLMGIYFSLFGKSPLSLKSPTKCGNNNPNFFSCSTGYRCFKSVLFLTGFSFGSVIVFLICQVEELLPQFANIGNP